MKTASISDNERRKWDIFISYASEDRLAVAQPLANALRAAGMEVWYDQFELRPGDYLLEAINEGLRDSRFGIVISSPNFFAKVWTQLELGALISLSSGERQKRIIPIWYQMAVADIKDNSPILSNIVAVRWEDGPEIAVPKSLEL